MHEINIVLKMWKLHESNEQDTSQWKRDRERDEKIKFATDKLKKNQITVEAFLEFVSNERIIPDNGSSNFNLILIYKTYFPIFNCVNLKLSTQRMESIKKVSLLQVK